MCRGCPTTAQCIVGFFAKAGIGHSAPQHVMHGHVLGNFKSS